MKNSLLIVFLFAFLFGCKKEEKDISSSSITINYNVGDHFTYKREIGDSKTDTFEILIPKDTLLNNKLCLVYIKRSKGSKDDITYIEQTDSSINAIGYWDDMNNIAKTLDTPKLMYLNPIRYGTNWLIWNMADTGKMAVTATELIRVGNKNYACMKIKHYIDISMPENPENYRYTEYVDTKGIVYSTMFQKLVYSIINGEFKYVYITTNITRISNE